MIVSYFVVIYGDEPLGLSYCKSYYEDTSVAMVLEYGGSAPISEIKGKRIRIKEINKAQFDTYNSLYGIPLLTGKKKNVPITYNGKEILLVVQQIHTEVNERL